MTKFKKAKLFPAFILLTIIALCCKKNQSSDSDSGQLQIIKNSALANSRNALQAIYTSSDNSSKGFYYGTFNSSGVPDSIFQIVISKSNGDTSINIFLDNQQRIKSLYLTYAGVKLNSLLTFDYSILGKTLVSTYQYNFNNDSSRLLYQYTVDNNVNYTLVNKTNYASFEGGLMQILLQINTGGGAIVPDKFGSQLITAQGAIAGLNLIIVTGSTAIGCLIGGFPGCVLGGIVSEYLIHKPASANASEISSSPSSSPPSPYNQTQNTQLQSKAYFVGTKNTSGVVPFGNNYYTVEYTNISFEVKQNKQTNSIVSANFYATMTEVKQADTSPIPGYPTNRQVYSLNTFSLTGPTLTINFTQDPNSFPQNNAVFVGGINGNNITGTLTLNRVSNGLTCVTNIPINALMIN